MIECDYIRLISEGARMCLVTRKPMAGSPRNDLGLSPQAMYRAMFLVSSMYETRLKPPILVSALDRPVDL